MVLTASMLSMPSCQTTRVVHDVPEIDIPDFPSPEGKTSYNAETDEVRMPLNYYEQIMKYKLKVQEAKKIYITAKELWREE